MVDLHKPRTFRVKPRATAKAVVICHGWERKVGGDGRFASYLRVAKSVRSSLKQTATAGKFPFYCRSWHSTSRHPGCTVRRSGAGRLWCRRLTVTVGRQLRLLHAAAVPPADLLHRPRLVGHVVTESRCDGLLQSPVLPR